MCYHITGSISSHQDIFNPFRSDLRSHYHMTCYLFPQAVGTYGSTELSQIGVILMWIISNRKPKDLVTRNCSFSLCVLF